MHVTARHGDTSFDGIGSKADCTAGMHILHENIYFVAQQQQQLHTWMDYTAFINEKWDIARSMSLCPDRWIYESTPSPITSFELNKTLIKMQNRLHCIHNKKNRVLSHTKHCDDRLHRRRRTEHGSIYLHQHQGIFFTVKPISNKYIYCARTQETEVHDKHN